MISIYTSILKLNKEITIKLISVNLPEDYLRILEYFVAKGKFPNRSEAIRMAIRDLIKTEYLIEDSVKNSQHNKEVNNHLSEEYQENMIF